MGKKFDVFTVENSVQIVKIQPFQNELFYDQNQNRLSWDHNANLKQNSNNKAHNINATKSSKKFNIRQFARSIFKIQNKTTEKKKNDLDLAKEVNIEDHLLTSVQLEAKYKTNLSFGLDHTEANFRLKRDGPNAFTPPKQKSNWAILAKEMLGGFAFIMWLSAIASLVIYKFDHLAQDYILSIVLVVVIVVTGLYSFSQQRQSKAVFNSFKNMIPHDTVVIRGGVELRIPADQLVVGDIVQCKSGERIPADIRILQCESMKVDNSSLTGESDPLLRHPDAGHTQALEAKNLAFSSTFCVDGSGIGLVISTGDHTVMGKIAKLVVNIQTRRSPIAIEIDRFVKVISLLSIMLGILCFFISISFKMTFFKSFIFMIGITVGNIPEGLLPALTLALTLTAKRMAQKNCLIKYLEAVETLGSTSIICSDKTGTLTQNRMTIEHCFLAGQIVHVTHEPNKVAHDMRDIETGWQAYQRCAKLCSRASFVDNVNEPDVDPIKRQCNGDATETAILRFMECISPAVDQYRNRFSKVYEKPFSSTYKYQYSIHRNGDKTQSEETNFFLTIKGAPERIIKLCSTIIDAKGNTVPITKPDIDAFENAYRELGSMGERVIAFADLDLPRFSPQHQFRDDSNEFELKDLRFLGLIAMLDPPRPSVPHAVSKCKTAGICVIMVTGDHPITAQAIAKSVGIISSSSHRRSTQISLPKIDRNYSRNNLASIVVPGDELANLTNDELKDILRDFNEIVFARTSPQQKLRIVENCQELGQIVAVTGDGVNDSPALKKADIGIAMGITGSDVSKQAADMILIDDNFSSIVVAVEEGRKIFDNMKKTIGYIMAGNSSELYPFIFNVLFGIPISISPIMMLCIALGTDLAPAISLVYEKPESDIMNLKPRNPKTDYLVTNSLLSWAYFQSGLIITASGYLGFFVTMMHYGWMPWQFWQIRNIWLGDMDYADYYGQIWSKTQRENLTMTAQTSYFASVVIAQVSSVLVNKTRRNSLFKHGMGNWYLNCAIVVEVVVAVALVYTPGLNTKLTFSPISYWSWLTGLPFFLYLQLYEEMRKYCVRTYPNSFLGKELAR